MPVAYTSLAHCPTVMWSTENKVALALAVVWSRDQLIDRSSLHRAREDRSSACGESPGEYVHEQEPRILENSDLGF